MKIIKRIVLNNKYLKMLWLMKQHRNSVDLINCFLGTDEYVKILPCADGIGGINYNIALNNPNDGFFALVRWTLDYLYFADERGFSPSVKWGDNCLYREKAMGDTDPFEYFFKPVTCSEAPSAVACFEKKHRNSAEKLNNNIYYSYSDEYIGKIAQTMKKYLVFSETVQRAVDEALEKRNVSGRTLGVHIRGTDYRNNYKNHPGFITPEEYYPHIDRVLQTGNFDKIYLATDDSEILNEFIAHYGKDIVVFDEDTNRSSGTTGIHIGAKSPYQAGVEVICDMICLAGCGGIITGRSQVGLFSRIYKKSRNEDFVEDIIVSDRINTTGKVFKA